ncbi:MAG TPA: SDR family oxidoreductase [Chthonomonas sp.]|uniref:SDR family oxidoreductase n=1 Tax=Chthonomonas sp. TaxID=2282153 RepID=UPI002B4ABB1A|nr:SDR family oxidoreductase [Chthonomonas sp.]HLH80015.1 SDR family oxidoreductase [Chthonomonas sp.]
MRLKDKVALVTGASSGIGKAIAERFAAEGAHVAVNYLPVGTQEAAAETEVATFGVTGIAVPGDVSRREDVERMVATVVQRFGRLDIAVNNAGIEMKKPFLDLTDEDWNKILSVNLYGAFLVCQAAARQMVKQGQGGKIINISSVHEDVPFPGYASYCTSKGGLRMLMRNLALELAPYQINVNNIAPGAIATPINQQVLDDPQARANAISEIPWGRFGKPEEVAAVAVFLASDESSYVTGSTYYVDGGLTQQVTKY